LKQPTFFVRHSIQAQHGRGRRKDGRDFIHWFFADPAVAAVCTENLNPHVTVMKPAKDWVRTDDSNQLNRARDRRIFVQ
jgi:hypothetical protein